MRIFRLSGNDILAVDTLSALGAPSAGSFAWVSCTREALQAHLADIQATLQQWGGAQLVDLHVSDLLNRQLPSHYDYTAQYDVLVFRRLAAAQAGTSATLAPAPRSGPPILRRIDTSPVGFVVMESIVLSVHPSDCTVRDAYADKLLQSSSNDLRAAGSRVPSSPPDLMLRIVNTMVDGFLELRRELNHQLDHWQAELLDPRTRFNNWSALLEARVSLHQLDEVCEDQRAAIQDWIEAVKTWPEAATPALSRERDLLQVRGRDVLEHIERVVHHVRRLEQSMETAVQMHFSAQGNRTNDIMRTLTALTAVFLPLNLIAGIFGMNFDAIPLLHSASGFWWAMGSMSLIAAVLIGLFWRKRYIARTDR
ncbi:magnesium transporter CorA family protein [Curvibacter sp. APW13]|uniref:magnesium transporter CorA family protein n=1 Tax=Curvibacter sp. APW13 TaxID=3077236 RepID=UPI0028E08B8C|nr:magnesium transporter CorA family protein [Curvibacter sp. APW13]MDT8990600.1 magnesium transporter CorA family protein [Curvibacter sp. APW13]